MPSSKDACVEQVCILAETIKISETAILKFSPPLILFPRKSYLHPLPRVELPVTTKTASFLRIAVGSLCNRSLSLLEIECFVLTASSTC